MKPIEIRARLYPFSHTPGVACLLPSTSHRVEVFPSLIRCGEHEWPLEVEGPSARFTVVQDLEHSCVTVFSESYHVHLLPDLTLVSGKRPKNTSVSLPRYHFGDHKKLEWERVKARCHMGEVFPLWLRLGQLLRLPHVPIDTSGMFSLLTKCEEVISEHKPERILPAFKKVFLAGFEGMMIPRNQDSEHQGILPSKAEISTTSPLYLLTWGAELIRSLFFRSYGQELVILPELPPELFAGRIVGETFTFGTCDIIWSKKELTALVLHAQTSGEIHLHFPPMWSSFRLKRGKHTHCQRIPCGTPLAIEAGEHYVLDCFEK